jgi:hypothetical protein
MVKLLLDYVIKRFYATRAKYVSSDIGVAEKYDAVWLEYFRLLMFWKNEPRT